MPTRSSTKRKARPEGQQPEGSSTAQDLPMRAKDDSPEISRGPKPSAQGTLKVFDDDDDEDGDDAVAVSARLSAVERPTVIADSEQESDSDDDDAPEAAATSHVVSKAERSAQTAQQAAQEQAAEQKRKRQQRDALFKQQATQRKAAQIVEKDENTEDAPEPSLSRSKVKGPTLNLLPDELLESSSEDEGDEDDDMDSVGETRPKRRKISVVEQKLARQDRAQKDERIGSTVYRVEKKRDQRLAPKAKKYSQSRKGGLLQRNRVAVPSKRGFFKK